MDIVTMGNTVASTVSTGLDRIAKIINYTRDYTKFYKDTSLAEITKLTRVEPITIVSKDLINNPETKVVLNSLLSIFTGYYLQAIDILTKVQDVEVVKILDRLNPDRDETGFLMGGSFAKDSFRLISAENYTLRLPTFTRPALEAIQGTSYTVTIAELDQKEADIKARLANLNLSNRPPHLPITPEERSKEATLKHRLAMVQHERLIVENKEQKEIEERDRKNEEMRLKGEEHLLKGKQYTLSEQELKLKREQFTQSKEESQREYEIRLRKMGLDESEVKRKTTESERDYLHRLNELAQKQADSDRTYDLKLKEHDLKKREYREVGASQDFDRIDLDTLVNLSIGRIVNVKIAYSKLSGDQKGENRFVTIPISVRLLVSSIPSDSISRIMTYKNQDLSLIERIHSARSGRIEFIRDLIFCQDIIDEYKKADIQDATNILSEISRRAGNAKKYGLLTRNPSLVAASTLFVISDAVCREIENKLGGKLDNPRIREKAFENTYAMIIAVVSEEWETVTFYVRGIARGSSFGYKELEGKTKGTGPDIGDIMKAITSGQPPSF